MIGMRKLNKARVTLKKTVRGGTRREEETGKLKVRGDEKERTYDSTSRGRKEGKEEEQNRPLLKMTHTHSRT